MGNAGSNTGSWVRASQSGPPKGIGTSVLENVHVITRSGLGGGRPPRKADPAFMPDAEGLCTTVSRGCPHCHDVFPAPPPLHLHPITLPGCPSARHGLIATLPRITPDACGHAPRTCRGAPKCCRDRPSGEATSCRQTETADADEEPSIARSCCGGYGGVPSGRCHVRHCVCVAPEP